MSYKKGYDKGYQEGLNKGIQLALAKYAYAIGFAGAVRKKAKCNFSFRDQATF